MIDMFHASAFFARDFLQQLSCRLRTVGLKGTALCKKFISFAADLASSADFSSACCKNVILSQINSEQTLYFFSRRIGKIQHKIKISFSLFTNQLPFFGYSSRKVGFLEGTPFHAHFNAFIQSVQRDGFSLNTVGSFVKMDTFALVKDNFRHLFFRQNRFCFVSLAHRKYSIAD